MYMSINQKWQISQHEPLKISLFVIMHEDHQRNFLNLNFKTLNFPLFMLFWNPQLMHNVWLKSYKRLAFFSKQMGTLMAPSPYAILEHMSIMQLFTPFSFTNVYNLWHLNELLSSMHKCTILTTIKTRTHENTKTRARGMQIWKQGWKNIRERNSFILQWAKQLNMKLVSC